jgi:heat shock protein HslJ
MLGVLVMLGLVLIALGGCAMTDGSHAPPPVDSDWILTALGDEAVAADAGLTARVESGRLSGQGPVNRWSCAWDGAPMGPVIATRMAGPPERMERERHLFEALHGATLEMHGDELCVVRGGEVLLRFRRG